MNPEPVLELLTRCPDYSPTPLQQCPNLAGKLGVQELWVKDETKRMGLGSFKALGGAYAAARLVAQFGQGVTLCCASAGNHGLSVAAGAKIFGAKAVIFLSSTVPSSFSQKLLEWGAKVMVKGDDYESSLKAAEAKASAENWVLLSDSSWDGYTEIPTMVMQGYTVIGHELAVQFEQGRSSPSHVFLQSGVGGFAAALAHHIRNRWPVQPKLIIVEPDAAPCLRESQRLGKVAEVTGPPSAMGRLDCKKASLIAVEILNQHADDFITISDQEAQNMASVLASEGWLTTPSGAAGLAGLERYSDQLEDASRCLVFLTEER